MSDSWTAEREQMKEEKTAMAIELAASRSDKELIQALHHRLRVEEDQRLNLVKANREVVLKTVYSANLIDPCINKNVCQDSLILPPGAPMIV